MAFKKTVDQKISRDYPNIEVDDDLRWIVSQPNYKPRFAEFIVHWYKNDMRSKRRRYTVWRMKYPKGNSERKMKLLLSDTQEYHNWVSERRAKRPNMIDYWLAKGMTHEDAIQAVSDHQILVNSTNVEQRVAGYHKAFASKTDEDMAEINAKKAVTEETYIKRYGGDEGRKRWAEILIKKDTTSVESFMSRGLSLEDAEDRRAEITKLQSENTKLSRIYWDNLYPNDPIMAHESHRKECDKIERFSLNFCVKKYGEEEGRRVHQDRTDRWIKSFYDRSDDELIDIYRRRNSAKNSKSSADFFDDLMSNFPGLTYQTWRVDGELMIKCPPNELGKKWVMYDFYCPKINLILEYDGVYWHGDNQKSIDEYKGELVKSLGYNFYRFFDDDKLAMSNCYNLINELKEKYDA